MFHPIVVIPFDDHVKIFYRTSSSYIIAKAELYDILKEELALGAVTPTWLSMLVTSKWGVKTDGLSLCDVLTLRQSSDFAYGIASWELNLLCNYNCPHCYLGVRPNETITHESRMRILDRMCALGVIRLQLTGGEPLIDRNFVETYEAAYDRGLMLTVSTNGSWLEKAKILDTFRDRPPLRVTVSLYGATATSYEAMTRSRKGTFNRFRRGITALIDMGVALRINIIVSQFNQHEVAAMQDFASSYTDDYHVYDSMSASIHGSDNPLALQADGDNCQTRERTAFKGCDAGVRSFHVDPLGRASMCMVSRETYVQLDSADLAEMASLARSSRQKLVRSGDCTGCVVSSLCTTCPVIVENYRAAQADRSFYCRPEI